MMKLEKLLTRLFPSLTYNWFFSSLYLQQIKTECVQSKHETKYIYGTLIFNMLRCRKSILGRFCVWGKLRSLFIDKTNDEGFHFEIFSASSTAELPVCELYCECVLFWRPCCCPIRTIRFSFIWFQLFYVFKASPDCLNPFFPNFIREMEMFNV